MKKILLITLSNIGDVILTTPVIAALKDQFPASQLTVVCGLRARDLLSGSQMIHELVIYDKHAPMPEQLRFILKLRKTSYDLVVDLRHTAIPYLVSAKKRSPFFRMAYPFLMREKHLEVLRRMGLSASFRQGFDFYHPEDEKSVLEKIKSKGILSSSWILAAPAAASGLKTWRLSGFREVIGRLLADYGETVLLAGDERERKLIESLTEIDPKKVVNVAGETSLRELAALVDRALLLITNDSAVMHLGYELGRPVAAVFGPTHHEKYGRAGPHFRTVRLPIPCSPCELPRCRFRRQVCFEDLTSDQVYQSCRELLAKTAENFPKAEIKGNLKGSGYEIK